MAVFFVFNGSVFDAHDARIGSLGQWNGNQIGSQSFGVFPDATPLHRAAIDEHHDDITVLPGISGKLSKEQASAIVPTITDAVEGMSMFDVLERLFNASGNPIFDPSAY